MARNKYMKYMDDNKLDNGYGLGVLREEVSKELYDPAIQSALKGIQKLEKKRIALLKLVKMLTEREK